MAEKYPFRPPGTPTDMIRDTMITGKPFPIKSMVVWGTNSIKTLPAQERTMKALKNMDFVMVTDVSPTDITMWADILLPEACYLDGKIPYGSLINLPRKWASRTLFP
jgi:thiosulfate reductase/polysulfide reductase chain A